ncbi:zinc finger MYM-type 1-like protein [Labeo rohita]|uniref:Zinc finger MYM-type 1-like protein n=1 Tax=Labeo rohita TaxID=84645 RepID=A0A498MIZ9_LABRO|nr:zinc finger MYM-type 1-like protein [Labeo rohita]
MENCIKLAVLGNISIAAQLDEGHRVVERFSFTKHLVSATLLQGDLFPQHQKTFPDSALDTTVEAYPSLDKARLKTELSLIYSNEEFQSCCGALALFQVLMENNLQDTFTETLKSIKLCFILDPFSTLVMTADMAVQTFSEFLYTAKVEVGWDCKLLEVTAQQSEAVCAIGDTHNLHHGSMGYFENDFCIIKMDDDCASETLNCGNNKVVTKWNQVERTLGFVKI